MSYKEIACRSLLNLYAGGGGGGVDPPEGGRGGGPKRLPSSGTFPAGSQLAIPCFQTIDSLVTCPPDMCC